MRLHSVLAASLFAAVPALAQKTPAPAPQLGPGFFKPAPDPALTSIRPAAPRVDEPGKPVDMAVEIRKAEEARITEAQMDRSEQEHERARAEGAAIATGNHAAVAVGTPASAMQAETPNRVTR